jgi:hypothetical protein
MPFSKSPVTSLLSITTVLVLVLLVLVLVVPVTGSLQISL